jgi:hypothetical protein
MGCRAENWPKEQLSGMALCFAQIGYKYTAEWKEEIVYIDTSKAATRPAEFATATLPDGKIAHFSPDRDPREDFAAWLITPANPWFAKTAVNRVWFWLMGRGIIEEPDDIRPDNPPSNAQLLTALEHELIASKYDLKHIYRLILNSRTYQLSSIAASDRPQAASVFAAYPLRRLDAEVLIDAICQITGTTESYTSAVPEPYTIMPGDERAIDLPDGSITSSFLELFGRPARDSGLESSRNSRPSQDQRLHMLNSSHVQRKIEQSVKLRSLVRGKSNPREAIDELYLSILSRYPTSDEYQTTVSYLKKSSPNTREGWIDLTWALMNCSEFLYQH